MCTEFFYLNILKVLVYHDLLGFMQHPHHAKVTPKFCKQYSQVGAVIQEALTNYKNEVNKRDFPCSNFSPYRMKPLELEAFLENLKNLGMLGSAQAAEQRASIEKLHESN